MQSEEVLVHISKTPGLAGTTPCMIREENGEFEARMGFALFGSTNMSEAEFEACDRNPFHPDFHDNFATGKGASQEEAEEDLKRQMDDVYKSMWI